jgi:hypothetical protein
MKIEEVNSGSPQLARNYLLLLLVPVIIVVFGELLTYHFAVLPAYAHLPSDIVAYLRLGMEGSDPREDPFPANIVRVFGHITGNDETIVSREGVLRYRVVGFLFILYLVSTFLILRFGISRWRSSWAINKWILVVFALSVFVAMSQILVSRFDLARGIFDNIGLQVYKLAREGAVNIDSPLGSSAFRLFRKFGYLLAMVAVICQMMQLILVLAKPGRRSSKESVQYWKDQSSRFQTELYLSTLVLVSALLYLQGWVYWPTYLFPGGVESKLIQVRDGYKFAADSYLVFVGIIYTSALAGIAIVVQFFLNSYANEIAFGELHSQSLDNGPPSATALASQRQSLGLYSPVKDQIKSFASVIAPLLAGTLPTLSSFLN